MQGKIPLLGSLDDKHREKVEWESSLDRATPAGMCQSSSTTHTWEYRPWLGSCGKSPKALEGWAHRFSLCCLTIRSKTVISPSRILTTTANQFHSLLRQVCGEGRCGCQKVHNRECVQRGGLQREKANERESSIICGFTGSVNHEHKGGGGLLEIVLLQGIAILGPDFLP